MRTQFIRTGVVAVIAALALVAGAGVVPAQGAEIEAAAVASRPFASHPVAFPTGSAHAPGTVAAADSATAGAYADWKSRYLKAGCGTGRYYVDASTSTSSLVVSEGQGYGMVITALMAGQDASARTIFDGLYRYVLDHPSASQPKTPGIKPMAWHQDASCTSTPGDDSSATDGDLDIAFSLLLADTQWGSAGTIDYAAEARTLLGIIKATEMNPQTLLPLLGDWTSPGDEYWFATRTSDFMFDHFIAFENATGDAFWGQAARATSELVTTMQADYAPSTGLVPDFIVDTDDVPKPAPPDFLESPNDGAFNWNAMRVPWRLAAGAQLTGDAASWASAERISSWIIDATGGTPSKVRAGYTLDGTPLVNYGDVGFTAPMAASGLPDSTRQGWVSAGWDTVRKAPASGYYSDSIRLQVMLLMSNNTWLPTTSTPPKVTRIGGADRYAVSASVSARTFAAGADTVYVASGEVFPDALSASAAAGAVGAPVLLVRKGDVPAPVQAELARLDPGRIVFLGGPNTIGPAVEAALNAIAPATRIGGADRYAVSAAVSAQTFSPGARSAYVPSGEVFPDALAGSAAAGAVGGPVLLTRKDSVPGTIGGELTRLDPRGIVVLGGPNSVATSTQAALNRLAPTTRIGGPDRYAVAAAISARTFSPDRNRTVYVASGEGFPDALSASATAIANHAPVLLVTKGAVPAATGTELARLSPDRIIVLGGANTVSDAVVTALAAYLAD